MQVFCNLSYWQIFRYDVYHPLTSFLLFSFPLAAKSPGSPLLLFCRWANTKVILADLWNTFWITIWHTVTTVICKCWMFSVFFSFFPTHLWTRGRDWMPRRTSVALWILKTIINHLRMDVTLSCYKWSLVNKIYEWIQKKMRVIVVPPLTASQRSEIEGWADRHWHLPALAFQSGKTMFF